MAKHQQVDGARRTWAVVAFAASLAVNGLAGSTTLLNGQTTGEISDAQPNLFAPAGLTFSIWGVIYLLLIGTCLYLFSIVVSPADRDVPGPAVDAVATRFTAASVLNGLWLLSWQWEVFTLSVVLMVALLAALLRLLAGLRGQHFGSQAEKWTLRRPFSIYAGWITIATLANVTTWAVSIGIDAASSASWAIGALMVGAVAGCSLAWWLNDWAYLLVFVWGYGGVLVRHLDPVTGFGGQYGDVITTVMVLLTVVMIELAVLARQDGRMAAARA